MKCGGAKETGRWEHVGGHMGGRQGEGIRRADEGQPGVWATECGSH